MKKISALFAALFLTVGVFAQCNVIVIASTNVSCFGSCNGNVTLQSIGTPTFTYLWAPGGQTIQNPTNLCAGTHTVTMTDASSCVSTATVTITQPAVLQDSIAQTNIASCDSCNGTATAYPFGGTAPYSHKWTTTPVQTSATATGLCPGTYRDTITDFNNCKTVMTVTITQATALSVATTVTNTSSSTACDGGVSASPSGGTAPYSYLWSPGSQTTSAIIAQCPGNYTVCVTDANGCSICDTTNLVLVTGIDEASVENLIHIAPNPSVGQFTISFDKPLSNASILVTNILGEEIFQTAITNPKMDIDLVSQPNGIYIVCIKSENSMLTRKIIISR